MVTKGVWASTTGVEEPSARASHESTCFHTAFVAFNHTGIRPCRSMSGTGDAGCLHPSPNSLRLVLPADEVLPITLKFHTWDTNTVPSMETLPFAYLLSLPLHFLHLPSSISLRMWSHFISSFPLPFAQIKQKKNKAIHSEEQLNLLPLQCENPWPNYVFLCYSTCGLRGM